jgi:hypothetical protein
LDDDGTPVPPPPPPPEKKYIFRMNATVENTPLSKQNVASDNIGLFIYKANTLVDPIQKNKSVTLNNGYYEYEIGTNDSVGYCFAYYPYSSTLMANTTTTYTGKLSPVQDQDLSSPGAPATLTNQMLMISDHSNVVKFVDEIANIQFKHVFSLLRFKITKDASLVKFNKQKIKKFEMYMASAGDTLTPNEYYKLAGEYWIDLKYVPDAAPNYSAPNFSSASAKITAAITNSPEITDTPIDVWILVRPFKPYHKLVVRMETEDDEGISYNTISTFSEFGDILRNKEIPFDVILKRNNLYSDDVVRESFVDKPANSYVISEPGLYEIAMKKPGGDLLPEGSVDWLWASKAGGGRFEIEELINDISIDAEDPQNKKIRFRVGSELGLKKGNVILALKNAANKDIVWTWHIWITDKPKNMLYGSKLFLDRNIGALSADTVSVPAIDTYGFVYQWGRKDPFFGGDGLVFDEADNKLSVARAHTIVNNESSGQWNPNVNEWSLSDRSVDGTIDKSIKYPMKFIYNGNSSSEENDPADWLLTSNTDLWSNVKKTDYDPCPYGYRVPSGNKVPEEAVSDFSMLYTAYNTYLFYLNDKEINPNKPLPDVWFYNHYNSNRYWIYSSDVDGYTVWPAAGMREGRNVSGKWNGAQLKYSGTDGRMGKGYYWTSTPLEINGRKIPGASSRICIHNTLLYSKTDYGPNADAYPVRCVKE